jgi:hypothetical protein
MDRCDYCKKKGASQKTAVSIWQNGKLQTVELPYCSDTCKQKLHSFSQSYNSFAPKFMAIVLVWLLLFMCIPFLIKVATHNSFYLNLISPILLAAMGILLILRPQGIMGIKYYRRMGVRYFTLFIRITGLLMIASGVSMVWK